MAGSIEVVLAQLEKKYCPPIDSATLLAILSDYDVTKPDELDAVRWTLDALTESVDAEEASGFDPSGSSGLAFVQNGGELRLLSEEESEDNRSVPGRSNVTEDTSISQGRSVKDLDGLEFGTESTNSGHESSCGPSPVLSSQLEGLDLASTEAILRDTFPGVKPFDIKWTLNKCKGDLSLAIEELLNQVFIEENGGRHRGLEAFSESELPVRVKRGKGRKKRVLTPSEETAAALSSFTPLGSSKWDQARQDVEFISNNTDMPMQQVSSIYHKAGASVPATITYIIEAHASISLKTDDPVIDLYAHELSNEFPTIPISRLYNLVHLTHPSKSSAQALAKAITQRSTTNAASGRSTPIQLEFRLPPPDFIDTSAPTKLRPKSHNAIHSSDQSTMSPTLPSDDRDFVALRNGAFNQASSAWRKGKSDPLMGGAAAYYSSLGRDFNARAKSATSAAVDAMVAQQSTATQLDLHGANVKDAVRIARDRVTNWWVGVGTSGGSVHAGYKIVTGKGTHSEGGRGKLGPAVGAMLIREGWKVEAGSGILIVTGVMKR